MYFKKLEKMMNFMKYLEIIKNNNKNNNNNKKSQRIIKIL